MSGSELFAELHIDNPLGQRIKGTPDCKTCKGEGYLKCRSGKHERACKFCLSKLRIEKCVGYMNNIKNEIQYKLVNPVLGCKFCKGGGLLKNKKGEDSTDICSCCTNNMEIVDEIKQ